MTKTYEEMEREARSESAKRAAETRRINKLTREIEERLEKLPAKHRNAIATGILHGAIGRAAGTADNWMKGQEPGLPDWRRAFWGISRIIGDLKDSLDRSVRDADYRANNTAKKEG